MLDSPRNVFTIRCLERVDKISELAKKGKININVIIKVNRNLNSQCNIFLR